MITKFTATTSAQVASTSKERRILYLGNPSDTDLFYSLDGTAGVTGAAGASPGVVLKAGTAHTLTRPWQGESYLNNAISVIHEGTGSKTLVIQEW
jgi:hypothetical protein